MNSDRLKIRDYPALIEQVILFKVEAWNWNCPQHIPIRYSEEEVEALKNRITQLEQLLAQKD